MIHVSLSKTLSRHIIIDISFEWSKLKLNAFFSFFAKKRIETIMLILLFRDNCNTI